MSVCSHLHTTIYLREGLRLCAAELACIATIVARRTVLEELRCVLVRLQDCNIRIRLSVVPLNLHVCVAILIRNLIKLLDEANPLRFATATGLLVDEPTIEADVLSNLVELLSIDIYAVLLGKHLAHPCLIATESVRREEHLTQHLHTALVSSVDRTCWRRDDDTLRSRTCPINELVHILPVGRLIAEEVVSALRRTHRTCREKNRSVADLAFIILILVSQWHTRAVELSVLVGLRRPVLDVVRVPTTAVRLLCVAALYEECRHSREN